MRKFLRRVWPRESDFTYSRSSLVGIAQKLPRCATLFVATMLQEMYSRATSFQYFCNNVQATGMDKKKWGGTTVTGATRDMSQCLAWSFSCRHCRHEIDNGTVQMMFLVCIPAACGQPHIAEVLFRNDSGILFGDT